MPNAALEELELDVAAAYPEHALVRDAEGVDQLDLHAAEAEAGELKEQIRRLGNVNLDAIDSESVYHQPQFDWLLIIRE